MPNLKTCAQKTLIFFLDLIFPPVCLACSSYLKAPKGQDRRLCEDCFQKIAVKDALTCPVCSRRLPIIQNKFPARPPCHKASPFVLASAASYENPVVRGLIRTLKYGFVRPAFFQLRDSVLYPYFRMSGISRIITKECLIVPIPLHPKKERGRGFNQSLLIAEALRDFLGDSSPLISRILVRVKNTKAQAEIKDSEKRKENVRNCFAVKNPSEIKGKNIILIDDVFTSGATANEAVRTLKVAGAKRVLVFVLAKA